MNFNPTKSEEFITQCHYLSKYLEFSYEKIKTLYGNITKYNEEHLENDKQLMFEEIQRDLSDMPQDSIEAFVDDVKDWAYFSEESIIILTHLMIVGLYSNYEKTLKLMLRKSGLYTDGEINSIFRYQALIDLFSRHHINYEDISDPDFIKVDEIRLLNNSIKHSGKVDQNLANRNSIWVVNDEIGDLAEHFIRLYDSPSVYLLKLGNQLAPNVT